MYLATYPYCVYMYVCNNNHYFSILCILSKPYNNYGGKAKGRPGQVNITSNIYAQHSNCLVSSVTKMENN